MDDWPAAPDLDAFRPLTAAGGMRAEALAARLKNEGVAAAYTSRKTRSIATAEPLSKAANIPLVADDATLHSDEMKAFLDQLRVKHAADRAVLVVGHSNTIPDLLQRLGATPDCYARLGITGQPGSLLTEGYDGLWCFSCRQGWAGKDAGVPGNPPREVVPDHAERLAPGPGGRRRRSEQALPL